MKTLFSDFPEAVEETVRLSEKCKCELDFKTRHYPVFIPPTLKEGEDRVAAAEKFLHDLCQEGIGKRYTKERLAAVLLVVPGKDPLQRSIGLRVSNFDLKGHDRLHVDRV